MVFVLGLGAAFTPTDLTDGRVAAPPLSAAPANPMTPDSPQTPESDMDPEVAKYLSQFRKDQAKINKLAARLEGNPVAPLVVDLRPFRLDEKRADDPTLSIYEAKPIAERAASMRTKLEKDFAKAKKRLGNASGTEAERIVDEAGDGFINIKFDSASACGSANSAEGRQTIGCVRPGDPRTVHVVPEHEVGSAWMNKMLVVHELAHVYQRADDQGAKDYSGRYRDLLDKGRFQGSIENMADCYALTYWDEWTLDDASGSFGYGYVCTESERKAIRKWAAKLDLPLR